MKNTPYWNMLYNIAYSAPKPSIGSDIARQDNVLGPALQYIEQMKPYGASMKTIQAPKLDGSILGQALPSIPQKGLNLPVPSTSHSSITRRGIGGVANILSKGLSGLGDALSLYGTYKAMEEPENITREHFSKTKPNINPYTNFGQKALQNLESQWYYLNRNKEQMQNTLSRQHSLNNEMIDKSYTSEAQRQAMLQDSYSKLMDASINANNGHMQQSSSLSQQEQNLLNQIDQVVMQGEAQRDLADRQDLGAFYSNLAQNKMDKWRGLQTLGGMFNQLKANKVNTNLLSSLSKYGFTIDTDGNIVKKQ